MVMREQLGPELCPATAFTVSEKSLIDIKINDIMIDESTSSMNK